ncbi:MAG TPA: response regulator [Brevundimonas sp.]
MDGGRQARVLPRILVVEDEDGIREPLVRYLSRSSFQVTAVESAEDARRLLASASFDLLILDVMLPGEDGLSLARFIRTTTDIPVILVTARTETRDRIAGLELGADDYVCKPFDAGELAARMRTVLRRVRRAPALPPDPGAERYLFGPWTLEADTRRLSRAGGDSRLLSIGEFRLLHALVCRPGRILSRDQLLDLTQSGAGEPFDRSIDNQISRLRRWLEEDSRSPRWLKTVWGAGYMLDAKVVRS